MSIIGNDIFCIGSNAAIDKFIVISILFYQPKVNVYFLVYCGVQSCYCFNNIVSNLSRHSLRKDFFIFMQDFRIYAKAHITRYGKMYFAVKSAAGGEYLQQAVGIKNDSSHNDREFACVPFPIA